LILFRVLWERSSGLQPFAIIGVLFLSLVQVADIIFDTIGSPNRAYSTWFLLRYFGAEAGKTCDFFPDPTLNAQTISAMKPQTLGILRVYNITGLDEGLQPRSGAAPLLYKIESGTGRF
jgi:hypothetical protein